VHFSLFVGVRGGIVFVVFVGQQVELEELKKQLPLLQIRLLCP
jgi:hypothetical protein